jgi:hypothetical protein
LLDNKIFEDLFQTSHDRIRRTVQDIVFDKQHAMLLATWHVAGDKLLSFALLGIFVV